MLFGFYANTALADQFYSDQVYEECGIKLGGGGKDSPWFKVKSIHGGKGEKFKDLAGAWSFIRQTYGPCNFYLYNKKDYKGRKATYGSGIDDRLRVGAKGGIDKDGWKARSLSMSRRHGTCAIQLLEDEPPGRGKAKKHRTQTFYGPAVLTHITGWSKVATITENCSYRVFNKPKMAIRQRTSTEVYKRNHSKQVLLKKLSKPMRVGWRIRSIEINDQKLGEKTREGQRRKYYQVKDNQGRCLDMDNVRVVKRNVYAKKCDGRGASAWYWRHSGNGAIVDGQLNGCLGVAGTQITDRSNVEVSKCNGKAHQRWRKTSNGQIRNAHGFCLGVLNKNHTDKTNVSLTKCKAEEEAHGQQWRFIKN